MKNLTVANWPPTIILEVLCYNKLLCCMSVLGVCTMKNLHDTSKLATNYNIRIWP